MVKLPSIRPKLITLNCALLLAAIVLPLKGCSSSRIESPFFTWSPVSNNPLQNASEGSGPFQASIVRQYEGDLEARLLARVEDTYPLFHDSVILRDFERPDDDDEPRWWTSEVDGARIPVAVTRLAIEYYLNLVRLLREDPTHPGGVRQRSARLEYVAEIQPAAAALEDPTKVKDLADKYIVYMEMSWTSDCGNHCGLRFTRTRTAVVSNNGAVLEVHEDPLAPFIIE